MMEGKIRGDTMDNVNGESRNGADLVDEINDDMDSFFDLAGMLGDGTVSFKTRWPDFEQKQYSEALRKMERA